jgi:predicted nucleotidyltransferase
MQQIQSAQLLTLLQNEFPELLAVYLFGSQAQGIADEKSDVDLAVLVTTYVDANRLWDVRALLEEIVNRPVDLVDLRAASTVMQYQIITGGRMLWHKDYQAAIFECMVLSEKTALDEARASLLLQIQREGRIYGR